MLGDWQPRADNAEKRFELRKTNYGNPINKHRNSFGILVVKNTYVLVT